MTQPKSIMYRYLRNVSRSFNRKAMNPPTRLVRSIDPSLPHEWLATGFVPRPKTRLGWLTHRFIRWVAINSNDNPPTHLVKLADEIPDEWLYFGMVRSPKTRIGWFTYHLVHGLMMRYPLWPVIAFSIINSKRA